MYHQSINHLVLKNDFACRDKTVLLRVDFNVPILNGKVTNDYRLQKSLQTINFLLEKNCKIILLSHLGRPSKAKDLETMTLAPVAAHLQTLLNVKVKFCKENRGPLVNHYLKDLQNKEILVLENTRFQNLEGNLENNNDIHLAKYWANLADVFVYDAFATAHRKHASTFGVTQFFQPKEIAIGFLTAEEITKFHNLLDNPQSPFTVIIGGGKPESKIPMIGKILPKVDNIIVSGALAYTFWEAKGVSMGNNNPVAKDLIPEIKEWYKEYEKKIVLPIDFATTKKFADLKPIIKKFNEIEKDDNNLDSGPETNDLFDQVLRTSKLIVWNGPPGMFEWSNFQTGTKRILEVCESLKNDIQTIVGGGDSAASAFQFGYQDTDFSHVSTGGGAFLMLLETNKLTAIEEILKGVKKS